MWGGVLSQRGVLSSGYTVASTTDRYMVSQEEARLLIVVVCLARLPNKENVCVAGSYMD